MKVEIGESTLYLGDCREIMPTLPMVDAVVTDPPYGIAYQQGTDKGKNGRTEGLVNRNVPTREATAELIVGDRTRFDPTHLLGYSNCIMWGANYYTERLPQGSWLVWDKRCGVYPELDQGDAEMAWCSSGRAVRVFRWLWTGLVKQKPEKAAGGHNQARRHPFEKPVQLMEWCILRFKENPHTVLDPYMGSGTTGVACANLGRKFIGIEIDPDYFAIAVERIKGAYAQRRLFA